MTTLCSIRGPCDDLKIRIWESGIYEPPTRYMVARLLLGNLRVTGRPFCQRDIPGPVIESWPWRDLIPPRATCVPPAIDPSTWEKELDG